MTDVAYAHEYDQQQQQEQYYNDTQQQPQHYAAASSTYAQQPMQTQQQQQDDYYAAQQQSFHQSPTSRAAPLFQGLGSSAQRTTGSTRRSRSTTRASPGATTTRPRARTPLPAPPRLASQSQFSKSASFASPPQASPHYLKGAGSRRAYAYAHLAPVPQPVFDPMLPAPTVVVHGSAARSAGFNKSVQERKHRGTSRNTSGGFYTS